MSDRALPRLLARARQVLGEGRSLVLATVVETAGSTYRKAGARMLIDERGVVAGVLGGGCFDSDLAEQAQGVLHGGRPRLLEYDMRAPEEAVWGLGLGCEGLVRIFLQPVTPGDRGALQALQAALDGSASGAVATLVSPADHPDCGGSWTRDDPRLPAGEALPQAAGPALLRVDGGALAFFCETVSRPPLLVICGAGVDALAVLDLARAVGWRVGVLDHRPGHVRPDRFPAAETVAAFDGSPGAFVDASAAMVMSHDLRADLRYLKALAHSSVAYVGLLGPTARRRRLLGELADDAARLAGRLHGPAGLHLGGELPEEVALSIVAELQARYYGADGVPLAEAGVK